MDKPRPYITAALFCEKVLQEKDETVSVVRIADRLQYRIEGPGLPADLKPAINIQGLVGIKSGPVTGDHAVTLVMERPSGSRKEVYSAQINLLGKDHGQNIIMTMGLGIEEDGLYWLDVLFDGEMLTRVPLMITRLETPAATAQT